MPQYTTTVTATSNAVANTNDTFVEISCAAGSSARIKRIHVSPETPSQDTRTIVSLIRTSTAGATGVAGAAVRRDGTQRATSATVNVKNAVAAFTVGTVIDTPWVEAFNGRSVMSVIPRNYMEEIIIQGGNRLVLAIQCSSASIIHRVDIEWED
jgi:hypothetical protein